MCKFDLLGSCNDESCRYWHFKDTCSSSIEDLIQNLVAYDLSFFDATGDMSMETKQKLLHSFTQQFAAQYSGKMSAEEHLLILWNKMKEKRKENKKPVYECVKFSPPAIKFISEKKDKVLSELEEKTPIQFKSQSRDTLYKVKMKSVKTSKQASQMFERYVSLSYST